MRIWTDARGRRWTVALGRSSWGTFLVLFVPDQGEEAREAQLPHASAVEAERALLDLTRRELEELLDRSTPRTP